MDDLPDGVDLNNEDTNNLDGWEQAPEDLIPNPDADAPSDCFLEKLKEILDNYTHDKWEEFETTVEELTAFAQEHVGIKKNQFRGGNRGPPNKLDPSTM